MRRIVSASEYNYRYIAFFEIDEDLDYLKFDNTPLFNNGLTVENSKEFILEEMKIFVEMESLNIPREQREKCYCETCKNLNDPITKNKFQLKKPFRYTVLACGICDSEKLKYSSNHDAKWRIIEQSKKESGLTDL
ncbi:hypothetical protein GCM10009120_49730 [Sphingobacterium siyangense subsp. cladoniae]|uniref:hypothetical protein n=1 Tax=Sphingobacterium siyangense TaxID=459529 RepID=UPI0031F873B2